MTAISTASSTASSSTGSARVDAALSKARRDLPRVDAHDASGLARDGALLVDIRPAVLRHTDGGIPGAIPIERNVLEWRLDPTSEASIPQAADHPTVIVVCDEGYASSFAAVALRELDVDATDLVGGFQAWRASGLPTLAPRDLLD